MFIRLLPWQLLALAAIGLVLTGTVAWIQTNDFLLQLFFAGLGLIVGLFAYAKYLWKVKGKILIWNAGAMHGAFGPSDNCTDEEYVKARTLDKY